MSGRDKFILLIEADDTLREVTRFRLELLGYEVVTAGSADAALQVLEERLPGVIVVGQYLPDGKGAELIDRLSNDLRTSEVPVMLVSPDAELNDVQRAFNAGADDYLVTPFDPPTLERKLKRLADAALGDS